MADEFDNSTVEALRLRHRKLVAAGARRRTGRTKQFNIRVRPEFKTEIAAFAKANGLLICEVVERALAALKRERAHE
jgi:predicted HicB family RNase H-like nuclease